MKFLVTAAKMALISRVTNMTLTAGKQLNVGVQGLTLAAVNNSACATVKGKTVQLAKRY
ncbi:hypothetical protein MJ580_11025 [Klebsiella pneumoniae]|nr:hypothetical protein MJ580_11025 [Klebsiella pneumoniae]